MSCNFRISTLKKVLCWNNGMSYEEAEKFLTYLINKYDKNKDGKFDYTGLYTINITLSC